MGLEPLQEPVAVCHQSLQACVEGIFLGAPPYIMNDFGQTLPRCLVAYDRDMGQIAGQA